ncbi:MAG: site-specific integrase, partial [Euryarchaeota archaeon]|nr:site-specific integrase [Euryarchaeota archaeon]
MKDIHGQKQRLDTAMGRYSDKIFKEDHEDIQRFVEDLISQGYSPGRVYKYICSLVSVTNLLKVSFREAEKKDIRKFTATLERSDYKAWTKHDLKVILRKYMRWLGKEETVDWMKIKQPKNGTLPQEVLEESDIKAMAEAAFTTRDKAFVLALYESGARIGEFLPLKIKHLAFDKHGARLWVTGKTGDRRIRLIFSVLPIQKWLDEHPDREDPEAYLWCQIPGPYHPAEKIKKSPLSYGFITRMLRELAEKAGVRKKVNPHAFRHARATFMARYLKEPEMREFFGWGRDSEMPSIYVHLSGRDVDS